MASKVVGDLVVRLEAQTEKFNRAMDRARDANRRFERQSRASKTAVDSMAGALRAMLPALSAAALINFTRRTIELGDAMSKQARILGLTVAEYSALGFASKQAGVEQDALFKAVKTFGDLAGEAALKGTGELVDALDVLKVSLRDGVSGQLKPTSQLLAEFAAELNKVEDPMLKISLAADAFGARGVAIVNLLPELAQGFDQVKRSAAAAGVLIDEATGAALERAQNRIDVFLNRIQNVSILGAGALIQVFDPDIEQQIDNVSAKLAQVRQTYEAALARGTDAVGLQRIADEYTFIEGQLRDLQRVKEKNEKLDKTATTDAEELLRRYQELTEIGKKSRSSRAGAGRGVLADFELGPLGGGRSVRGRRRPALDYEIGIGPLEGGFKTFRKELTDTQAVLVDGTRSTMSQFTSTIGEALTAGEFRFDRFAQSVLGSLTQIITSALLTKFIATPLLGLFGATPSADGNAFSNGRVVPFARGGVVNRPTLFPMANGAGLMGEAGPEAVLPLKRTASGRLGVEASGGGGSVFAPSVVINYQSSAGAGQEDSQAPRELGAEVRRQLEEFWRVQFRRETRTGGVLNPIA